METNFISSLKGYILRWAAVCVVLLGFTIAAQNVNATHLIGGSMSYIYLGDFDNDGNPSYRINFVVYQDCNSGNWGNAFPSSTLPIGVYEGALNGSNLPLTQSITLPLLDSGLVKPNFPDTCKFGIANYCVYETVYSAVVELDSTGTGYHFVADFCCRGDPATGNGPINVQFPPATSGQQDPGSLYHAWVGPSARQNSSVIFAPLTEPYICLGDTNVVNNSAVDPDGDILYFDFYHPYAGNGAGGSSAPQTSFSYPVPAGDKITYAAGYGQPWPFGITGGSFAVIDTASGVSAYKSNTQGIYLLGMIVIEKDTAGNIVGVSEREFQYIVALCQNISPNNTAANQLTDSLSYNIQEGDSVCIDVIFEDPDGASTSPLGITFSGSAFDTSLSPPALHTTPILNNQGQTVTTVCWGTTCDQGRDAPYFVIPIATDVGCPPRSSGVPYEVNVIPFRLPSKIKGDTSVCQGPTYTYEIDSIVAINYNWSVVNGQIIGPSNKKSVQVQWFNINGVGSVTTAPVSEFGCTDSSLTLNVKMKPLPGIDAGTDKVICEGDSVTIGGSPSGPPVYSFSWNNPTLLNDDSIANPIAKVTSTTDFIMKAVDTAGCFLLDTIQVFLIADVLTAGPDLYTCPGDSIGIKASGADFYSWSPAIGLSSNSISNPLTSPPDTTFYILTGTFAAGACVYFDTLRVDVDTIVPTNLLDQQDICFGLSTDIGGNPTSPPNTTFKWTPNYFLSSDTAANPLCTTPNDTTYYLEAFNGACFGYDTIFIHVDTIPHLDIGVDTGVCVEQFVQFDPIGDNLTNFQWFPDSIFFNDTLEDAIMVMLNSGFVKLEAYGATGCVAKDSIFMTKLDLPNPGFPLDSFWCFGDTMVLDAGPGQSYVWTPNQFISSTTDRVVKISPADTTTYNVEIIGLNGCLGKDTITVNMGYVFSTVSNDTLICPGDTIDLFATGGVTYRWYNSSFISDSSIANPRVYPGVSTYYVVDVTSNTNCTKTDSILVEVSTASFIVNGSETKICYDDTTNLTVTGLDPFEWSPNYRISDVKSNSPFVSPLDTTKYYVSGLDSNNCPNTDSITIAVLPRPETVVQGDKEICAGDTAYLGGAPITDLIYNWTPEHLVNGAHISNPYATTNQTTAFVLEVLTLDGCNSKDTINIGVFHIQSTPDTFVCVEDGFVIEAIPRFGTEPFIYDWTPVNGLSDTTIGNPTILQVKPTVYTVIITDAKGCVDTSVIDIGVGLQPTAEFDLQVVPSCEIAYLYLTNRSRDYSSILWRVGEDSSSLETPRFIIPYGQESFVELIVTSEDRCTDTAIAAQEIVDFETYVQRPMPNIFSPNGDGLNDWFEFPIEQRFEDCTVLQIFNRWGALVHQSEDVFHSWDGTTLSGEDAPEGTYYYVLQISDVEWRGSIDLQR